MSAVINETTGISKHGVSAELAAISTHLGSLFPARCAAVACSVTERPSGAFDDARLNQRFSRARKNQFLAGRWAASTALGALGSPVRTVPRGVANEPVWPEGVVGAIAHIDDIAVAVVARRREISGLGIDLEVLGAVSPDMWQYVFSAEEIRRLQASPPSEQAKRATVAFSAKEAFFKLQFPYTRRWVDFDAAQVTIVGDRCLVRVVEPFQLAGSAVREVHGAFRVTNSNVLVGLWAEGRPEGEPVQIDSTP